MIRMIEPPVTIRRKIEDITYEESTLEEVKERVRHDMVDEGFTNLDGPEFENRVQEELLEMAVNSTMYSQGDNRLHNDITHEFDD